MVIWNDVLKRALWTLAEGVIGGAVAAVAYLTTVVTDTEWVVVLTIVASALSAIVKNYFTERADV